MFAWANRQAMELPMIPAPTTIAPDGAEVSLMKFHGSEKSDVTA